MSRGKGLKRFLILLFVGLQFSVFGQDIKVSATIQSTEILIGDQTQINISVEKPKDIKINLPGFKDKLSKEIEVIDQGSPDTLSISETVEKISQTLIVTSFDSGFHMVPPFMYAVVNEQEGIDTFVTNALFLAVQTVEVDTSQAIKDIKGPEDTPLTLAEVLPLLLWTGGIVAIILIALFLFLWWRSQRKEEEVIVEIPKEPAHRIALRDLDRLNEEKIWQRGEVKEYHDQLTDIVRAYIENRWGIQAMEMTTDETLSHIRRADLDRKVPFTELELMLRLADMAKFAKGNPDMEENIRSMKLAYEFVRETKKSESTETENTHA